MSDPFPRGSHPCASGPILSPVDEEIELVDVVADDEPEIQAESVPGRFWCNMAFPRPMGFIPTDVVEMEGGDEGMNLVDWFAGQCLGSIGGEKTPEAAAEYCYRQAVAMMHVRERLMKKGGA